MTSPDTRTRALERDMDPEAAGALLRDRIRAGEAERSSVEVAALLGHPAALLAADPNRARWGRPLEGGWPLLLWVLEAALPLDVAREIAGALNSDAGRAGRNLDAEVGTSAGWIPWEGQDLVMHQLSLVAEVLCWGPPS